MSNRAVHQFPLTTSDGTNDVLPIDREISPGVWKNFSIPKSQVGLQYKVVSGVLSSAQILDLHDTPVVMIAAPPSDKIIIPRFMIMKAIAGSVDYDTNLFAYIGPSTILDDNHYAITGYIPMVGQITSMTTGPFVYGLIAPGTGISASVQTADPLNGDYAIQWSIAYTLIDA
jgi:hypothetical protein